MFNKPKGVIVTRSDERKRKTVYDILPKFALKDGWMPIGRLDKDSRGLLLFTKTPHLANIISTPGNCSKIYELKARGRLNDEHCVQALRGVNTAIGVLRVNRIEILGMSGPATKVRVELREGKNRHLRRLFGALKDPKFNSALKVLDLKRLQISSTKLDVPSSAWRFLTPEEEEDLILSATNKSRV